MEQVLSPKDFVPRESVEKAGILDVFPFFHTAQLGQKIRRKPQSPPSGVALYLHEEIVRCPPGVASTHKRSPCDNHFPGQRKVTFLLWPPASSIEYQRYTIVRWSEISLINRQVNHGSRHRDRRLFFIRILWFQDSLTRFQFNLFPLR